jgi:hypothetical protein
MDEDLYGCDICDGLFEEDDMWTLGGDNSRGAYPAECNDCAEEHMRRMFGGARR